jgi:peptidoglycan/LPS O-acetylase OafA/YrhL
VKEGIIINWKSITLSFISLLSIIYFEYFSTNEEPWFFSTGWKFHRWPCYYYTAVLGVYLLNIIFQTIKNNEFIKKWIGYLATCSYEIFLVQMAVCSLLPQLSFIPSTMLRIGIRIILIFSISILGGIMVNKGYNRLLLLFNNGIQKNN